MQYPFFICLLAILGAFDMVKTTIYLIKKKQYFLLVLLWLAAIVLYLLIQYLDIKL